MLIESPTDAAIVGMVTFVQQTAETIQVELSTGEKCWYPLSQIHETSEIHAGSVVGQRGCLIITRWLAQRRR